MLNKYSGVIKGFQVVTSSGKKVILPSATARNLNEIIDQLKLIYDLDQFLQVSQSLSEHMADQADPHTLDIDNLSKDILKDIYNTWVLTHEGDYDRFVYEFFYHPRTIEDSRLLEDTEEYTLTVAQLKKQQRLYHTGPIYTHTPILDQLFSGSALENRLLYSGADATYDQVVSTESYTYVFNINNVATYTDVSHIKVLANSGHTMVHGYRTHASSDTLQFSFTDGNKVDTLTIPLIPGMNRVAVSVRPNEYEVGIANGTTTTYVIPKQVDTEHYTGQEPPVEALEGMPSDTHKRFVLNALENVDIYSVGATHDEMLFLLI